MKRITAGLLCAMLALSLVACGGGLTLSDGEPLLQLEKLMGFLKKCRENGINIAVETCGAVDVKTIEKVSALVDVFLFDVKSIGADKFKDLLQAA